MRDFFKKRESLLVIILIALMIVISISNGVFWRVDNLMDVLKNASVLGILSCGMLLVVLTGGIDISVSAVTAACTCITAVFLKECIPNIPLVFVVSVACGLGMGLGNGLLISRFRIPPIVATLGSSNIIYGIVKFVTNGKWINEIPENFTIEFGQFRLFGSYSEELQKDIGLPVQVLFLIGAIIFTYWLLKHTKFGRSVYAMGGNREAAERMGYNVKKSETLLYGYIGAMAGYAAVIEVSILRQVDPNTFNGYEMNVIAATVIGGVSITGGYGSVLGAMLGVFLMTVLQNGLILMRIPTFWQQIVTGAIIILVVAVDAYTHYMREKNRLKVDVEPAPESLEGGVSTNA